jgi:hypothetical protein
MSLAYVGYKAVATNTLIKTGPAKFYGLIANDAATVTIYDNTAASGTIIYTKTLAAGDVVQLGGVGIALGTGLYAATNAAVVVLYQ